MAGDARSETDVCALQACRRDGEWETSLRLEVLDATAVRAKCVDQRSDGTLLHTGVPGDDCALLEGPCTDKRANGGEEASCGTRVAEVNLLVVLGH